ncbi:MAG: metallophosphoesterase [Bacteroidia bacterium]
MKKFSILIILYILSIKLFSQTTIIGAGASWKYLDNGSDQGTAWRQSNFNDASWASGNAELGYGDGDEATVVSYGGNSNNKHITTYFRKSFNVTNPAQFSSLTLELVRDDGAVVYINGQEVVRSNMPSGNITYTTLANNDIFWPNEDDWNSFTISAAHLIAGTNVIAVEIHQSSVSSSDISFNLKLIGNTAPINATITRGPYLQRANQNGIVIRWRTNVACDSRVIYGTSLNNLNQTAVNTNFTTEHEVLITGLNPNTKYYYTIGTNQNQLITADANTYFKTHPLEGEKGNYRFWVIGDAGTGNNNQRDARNAFYNFNNNKHIDGWLMLGDNAYDGGFDNEYQAGVFENMYEQVLKNTVLWPAPGNHDYNNNIPFSGPPAYFDIFTLPTNGEAGGVPSGTEKYYSWNFGNVHFISLDSYSVPRSTTGAMASWLQADLAANTLPWVIAYWHHPPYTKGSHDSDNPLFYDFELVDMRENIVPILEQYGVDLVLNGHSHCYERSYLIDGHYGNSGSLTQSMIKNNTSGSFPTVCPYQKHDMINRAHKGAVYAVVGCSGKLSDTSNGWPHPVMHSYTNTQLGSMLIEVNDNRLDAKFITSTGSIYDSFTIVKNAGKKDTINTCAGEKVILKPSWFGANQWFPGGTSDSLEIYPTVNTNYFVSDSLQCIKDTFTINILPSPPCSTNTTALIEQETIETVKIYPSIVEHGKQILINIFSNSNQNGSIKIIDMQGKTIDEIITPLNRGENLNTINTSCCQTGIYLILIETGTTKFAHKIQIH